MWPPASFMYFAILLLPPSALRVSPQGCGSAGVGSCWEGQLPRTADVHLFFLVMGARDPGPRLARDDAKGVT